MFQANGIITLMTDFGNADVFVGVMKGVIAGINPSAKVIDLSHEISPFDALEAACLLRDAYRYFPAGTVHTVVVDPGVGTSRRILALAAGGQVFLAPDTGIVAPVERECGREALVRVTKRRFFLPEVSATFHGRDIFAPVAAHLSRGVGLEELGPPMDSLVPLAMPEPERSPEGVLRGQVLRFDRFGNVVTNIRREMVDDPDAVVVRVAGRELPGVQRTFAMADPGELVAVFGSFGALEIAVNAGNARESLGIRRNDPVEVVRKGRA